MEILAEAVDLLAENPTKVHIKSNASIIPNFFIIILISEQLVAKGDEEISDISSAIRAICILLLICSLLHHSAMNL
ncbi:MAG: hypothetical protein PUH02_05470 [bacterium]|nr:hypothetical protein [bacterium]